MPRALLGLLLGLPFGLPFGLSSTASAGRAPLELQPNWSLVRDGASGSIDRIHDVATDPGRALLLCGTGFESGGVVGVVMKLDLYTGDVVWTTRLDETVDDRAVSIVVDEQGASYVAGSTTPNPPFPDVLVAKIDADGTLLWSRSFDELANNDEGVDIALGLDDSVVVAGHANGFQGANYFLAKLGRDGGLRWMQQWDGGEGSQTDEAVAVATDVQGGVLVTGTSKGRVTALRPDVVTLKYSPTGQLLWVRRFDGQARAHDIPWDLAATSDGGCVVVGQTEGLRSGSDPLVLRYAADGELLWSHVKGSKGGDSARAVVLDPAGTAFVTGSTFTGGGGFDVLVLAIREDGRRAWQRRVDGGEGLGDAGQAITLDWHGRVLVAATAFHDATETDVMSLVFHPRRGELLATATFDAPAGLDDAPLAIASESFSFYVGGFANFPSDDFLALRYDLPDLL